MPAVRGARPIRNKEVSTFHKNLKDLKIHTFGESGLIILTQKALKV
jgi:hypothetical protein